MATTQVRLSDGIETYLRVREARGTAATTLRNEAVVLRRFLAWYGDVQLRHMTALRVADWFYGEGGLRAQHKTRDGRVRPPIAPSTHNYYRTRLNSLFRFATQRGWIRTDLLAEVDVLKEPTVLRQRPDPQALNQIIDNAENARDRALLCTLIHTALRRNEVLRLTVGDLSLADGWMNVYISKSQLEDRLPLTANLERELRRWLLRYAADLGRPLAPGDRLFPARKAGVFRTDTQPDGTRALSRTQPTWVPDKPMSHPERAVKAALAAAGRPTLHEGCHTLRRAAARAFFDELTTESGYDSALRIVSAWLHHKNSTTTERYLGLDVERKRRDEWLRGREFLSPSRGSVVAMANHQHRVG